MAAAAGFIGFRARATASGSSNRSSPSKSTDFVSVDLPEPFGPAMIVRRGTPVSGGSFLDFAENFEILSGRGSRNPADFESSPIRLLHHIETFAVEIEDGKPGCKRLLEGSASRGTHCVVKLFAGEFVSGHTQIVHTTCILRGNAGRSNSRRIGRMRISSG